MAKRKQRRDEFQDISSYSSKQAYKKNQKKKKRTGLKVFLSFICVILVLVGGVMIYASTVLLGDLKTTTITKDKTVFPKKQNRKRALRILRCSVWMPAIMTAVPLPGAATPLW